MHFSQVEESLESSQGHLKMWTEHFTHSHFMKLQLTEDLGGTNTDKNFLGKSTS